MRPHGYAMRLRVALGGLTAAHGGLVDCAVASRGAWRPHGVYGCLMGCTAASRVHDGLTGCTAASRVAWRPHGGTRRPHGGTGRPHGGTRRPRRPRRPHGGLMAASWRHWAASWRPRRPHGGNRRPHDGTGRPHGGNRRPHDGTGRPHDGTGRPHGGNRRSHGGPRGRTAYTAISIWRSIPSMLCCAVLCCTVRSSAPPIDPRQGRVGDKGISKKVTVAPDEVRTRDLHLTKVSLCH